MHLKTFKTFAAATILSLAPLAVAAQCNYGAAEQQAMSCMQGSQFDVESGACVPVAST